MLNARALATKAVLAAMVIPLGESANWHHLQFSDIRQNQVEFGRGQLSIQVDQSSSPLFYPFHRNRQVKRMKVGGTIGGFPKLPTGATEGEGKADDFALRVGLVLSGNKRLGWLERIFAPGWIKKLEDAVPEGAFYRVWFLSIAQQLPKGFKRTHPQNEVLLEEVGLNLDKPGPFALDHRLSPAPVALGIWIHADGDDTKSAFTTTVAELTLETVPASEVSTK